MKVAITVTIDEEALSGYTDVHLAALWSVTQANPADISDKEAGDIAERVGREIIRRFVLRSGPELWAHQGRHAEVCRRIDAMADAQALLERRP